MPRILVFYIGQQIRGKITQVRRRVGLNREVQSDNASFDIRDGDPEALPWAAEGGPEATTEGYKLRDLLRNQ